MIFFPDRLFYSLGDSDAQTTQSGRCFGITGIDMAQPSVAREPSMEEILASIRQIIESNEPGAGRALSASLPPVYGDDEDDNGSDIQLTVDQAYAGVEFPDPAPQTDPRFVAANSAGSAPAQEAPARAMSLADVAARVRAASERNVAQPQRETPQEFRQQQPTPAHLVEAQQTLADEARAAQPAVTAAVANDPAPVAFETPAPAPSAPGPTGHVEAAPKTFAMLSLPPSPSKPLLRSPLRCPSACCRA
jgi:cell pole-organizing protein PopZ